MGFIDEKVKKNLLTTSIVIVILFLIAILLFLVKTANNDLCGASDNFNIPSDENILYDNVLNSDNSYLLQTMSVSKKEINYYEYYNFCFNSIVSINDYLEVNIIDVNDDVLGVAYLSDNFTGDVCVQINANLSVDNNFLGVKCVNCDSNNNLSIASSLSKYEVTKSVDGFFVSNSLDYNLLGVKKCNSFLLDLIKWMIIFVLLMSLIWFIDIVVDWFKRFAFDGW